MSVLVRIFHAALRVARADIVVLKITRILLF